MPSFFPGAREQHAEVMALPPPVLGGMSLVNKFKFLALGFFSFYNSPGIPST